MSGSGGFYKYHCKYFLTHNCQNWVFVNNAPCAECCAAGRDALDDGRDLPTLPDMEIGVPVFHDGVLRYALLEMVVRREPGDLFATWIPRFQQQQTQPQPQPQPHQQFPPHAT